VFKKNKITNIRHKNSKKLFDFLVSKLSTHTGLDCIKTGYKEYLMLGPLLSRTCRGGGEEGQIVNQSKRKIVHIRCLRETAWLGRCMVKTIE
jgi:hypothetical protein